MYSLLKKNRISYIQNTDIETKISNKTEQTVTACSVFSCSHFAFGNRIFLFFSSQTST